jgi:uncharacterized protein
MKSPDNDEYANYRLQKSRETIEAAALLIQNKIWNSAVNRLYYAAYYAVSALLIKSGMNAKTHAGLKTQFFQHFVKTGKIDTQLGKVYDELFDIRQQGDYGDFFDFTEEDVLPLLQPTKALIEAVIEEINQESGS